MRAPIERSTPARSSIVRHVLITGGEEMKMIQSPRRPSARAIKPLPNQGANSFRSQLTASIDKQMRLLPSELAKEKGVGIAFLDVGEEWS
ncbi:hypothetical protein Tco_0963551 [Tanacetum coccineum]